MYGLKLEILMFLTTNLPNLANVGACFNLIDLCLIALRKNLANLPNADVINQVRVNLNHTA